MNRCQVKSVNNNNTVEFVFSGCIDESLASYLDVFPKLPTFNMNFKDITSINSTGIREWIKLITKLKDSQINCYHCPKVFIDQVNMVKGFVTENVIIHVPYFSEDASLEKVILLESGKNFQPNFVNFNEKIKDENGVEFEIDVIPAKYFKFIKPN
jgi:hypothetical protein